jgi:hypothetical protein
MAVPPFAGPSKNSLVPLSSLFRILSTPPQEPALPPPFCIVFAAPLGRPTAARSSNVELRTSLKQRPTSSSCRPSIVPLIPHERVGPARFP